jgi:hypothetical protein
VICAIPWAIVVLTFSLVASPSIGRAQLQPPATPTTTTSTAQTALDVGATEWMVTFGPGWGFQAFHSTAGHNYFQQTISWGRVLIGPKLQGPLRGRLTWAVEVSPVFYQYRPNNTYGFGFTPLNWRWNFEPRGRYAPFMQLAAGVLKTTKPVPQETLSNNFTAHVGLGARLLLKSQQSLVIQYRFDHISNGNRVDDNPGVNAHAVHLGVSVVRPKR